MLVQVVYVGDGNNIVHSWIRLAAKFDFEFVCACPKGYEPDEATMELAREAGGKVSVSYDPMEVSNALCLPAVRLCGALAVAYLVLCCQPGSLMTPLLDSHLETSSSDRIWIEYCIVQSWIPWLEMWY